MNFIISLLVAMLSVGLTIISIKTNWFHFSIITFLCGYFLGSIIGFVIGVKEE